MAAAHLRAYSNLTVVPLYRNHTIFHRIEHEYHFLKVGVGWAAKLATCIAP